MSNAFETIRIVDGISFRLPEASLSGAEQARVRLSDLAQALGYAELRRYLGRSPETFEPLTAGAQ